LKNAEHIGARKPLFMRDSILGVQTPLREDLKAFGSGEE
jgi:hypothetical protein